MSRGRVALVAVAVGALVVVAGYGVTTARAGASAGPALGPGTVTVDVDVRYSRFGLDDLRVRRGTLVRFVVHNRDPINHEFVVGGASVHAAHARGSERTHPPVPGEVSVGAHDVGVTVYRFDRRGTVEYACHLPGHVAYGMVGEIDVT
jgi:uncharacterized cupredoxin-like copper-binding protein